MADGEFSFKLMESIHSGNMIAVNPWLIVALAAHYKQEREMFENMGQDNLAFQSDYMLTAMESLAGAILHNDPNYFTFGLGNDEAMENLADEY